MWKGILKVRASHYRVVISRYATILYYLNDVEDGGETAFPVADSPTFHKKVSL